LTDPLGRTPLAEGMKAQIDAAFSVLPDGKRGALLVMADELGARAHLAAKLGTRWKVAAGAGVPWGGTKPSGWVGIMGAW
jgi:hypothetical protein